MKVSQKNKIRPGNLPSPLSTFIGRERELTEVRNLLDSYRLVTLTGAGGAGKTRLALKVAEELGGKFKDGTWFIEFASIFDPVFVPQAVASALNIREQSVGSLTDVLVESLSTRRTLLIFDNCEHLISACAQLAELLVQKCPDLRILATSREVLGITGEVAWTVPPLSLPNPVPWKNTASAQDAVGLYEESESVQLFVARATANASDFKLTAENGACVAEICRQLDGMPLAIELAAARVRSLSVQQIAQRLDDRFHLLTVGSRTAPRRQQTLSSTLDWSYALLSDAEQNVLQRLSVFASGATLDAAEAVCAGAGVDNSEVLDTLALLVNKSLVTADISGHGGTPADGEQVRYRLLVTIRQYAYDKLVESGRATETRNRHLDFFLRWAEEAEPQLFTSEQVRWLDRFEAEHDNLRIAMEWGSSDASRAELGLRLAAACGRFWRLHGYLSEGRMHLSVALSSSEVQQRTRIRAQALMRLANFAYLQSDYHAMRPLAEEALSIWRELGGEGKAGAAYTLDLLGELETEEGHYDRAPAYFREALQIYEEIHDRRGIGQIHMQFGWAAMRTGDYRKAQDHLQQFLGIARQVEDKSNLAFALSGLGEIAVRQGEYKQAISLLRQGLALNRERGDKWGTATLLGSLGWVKLRQREWKKMRDYLEESLAIRTEIRDKGGIAWCLEKLAEAKFEQSHIQDAVRLFGRAEAVRAPIGSVIDPADQPEYSRIISKLRAALGMDAFAAAWADGGALQLEDAIELALFEPQDTVSAALMEKGKLGGLTSREREVAMLIAQGKSNREIAEAMTVGVKTVETYVTRILNKLGFDSRVQIATWAMDKGLR